MDTTQNQQIAVGQIILYSVGVSSWAELTIDRQTNPDFCLALCLLNHDLTSRIKLTGAKGDIEIQVGKADAGEKYNLFAWESQKDLRLQLTAPTLGYWLRYFLEYYRDGVASVNHIDFEAASKKHDDEFFLVLATDTSPMSPSELRRQFSAP